MTRHGLEEYVSDCVIFLDHRVTEQIATRRLRVVKYRGCAHGTNEYPDTDRRARPERPAHQLARPELPRFPPRRRHRHPAAWTPCSRRQRLPWRQQHPRQRHGGHRQDAPSPRPSPTASAGAAAAVCTSPSRNPRRRSSGTWPPSASGWSLMFGKGRLQFEAVRPNYHGLEGHLLSLHGALDRFRPAAVVIDPITGLGGLGSENDIRAMLTRIVGHLKNLNITSIFTSLTGPGESSEQSEVGVSSLMDTWILIRMVESANNERLRRIIVIKSRGTAHSSRVKELVAEPPGHQPG
ncbi:MAG: hypothetical protein MZV64_11255 [Ignavibacteriales bacterium]|nr:hypothetical protein [Ignavibacteriales bacterium]